MHSGFSKRRWFISCSWKWF